MKRNLFFAALVATILGMTSCGSKKETMVSASSVGASTQPISPVVTNSRATFAWPGSYAGVTPGADCDITLEITLNENLTYSMRRTWEKDPRITKEDAGAFEWNATGVQINLEGIDEGGAYSHFLVEDGYLILLDINGQIPSTSVKNYTLRKNNLAQGITSKHWQLVELNGQPVTYAANATDKAFIKFNTDGTVSGNAGCNQFNGSYALKEGNRIHFEQMATTMKMCLNMDTETKLLKALEIADNYNVTASTLILNRARMAPLAKFEALYME
ncbi:MAG: META domain-containing protein [Candidatus Symbiothrix sp.]|jgi:heat shock protein HslJ|nr:META domain-containing protein [Candidatus Symbiothrix sp.]